jgi:hypothetical protein
MEALAKVEAEEVVLVHSLLWVVAVLAFQKDMNIK